MLEAGSFQSHGVQAFKRPRVAEAEEAPTAEEIAVASKVHAWRAKFATPSRAVIHLPAFQWRKFSCGAAFAEKIARGWLTDEKGNADDIQKAAEARARATSSVEDVQAPSSDVKGLFEQAAAE